MKSLSSEACAAGASGNSAALPRCGAHLRIDRVRPIVPTVQRPATLSASFGVFGGGNPVLIFAFKTLEVS